MGQTQQNFPSKEAAIQRACAAMGDADFHDAFIMSGNHLLLDKHDLRRECERRKARAAALKAVAEYVLRHSDVFVTDGPRMLSPEQKQRQQQRIEAIAKKIGELAVPAERSEVSYEQFETLLGELHKLGFFPKHRLSQLWRIISCERMSHRRNRLSVRIPWLLEAVAEGPFAIIVLLALAFLMIAAKGMGWW